MIELPGFLSPEECAELMDSASPHLEPATVTIGTEVKICPYRVASTYKFSTDTPCSSFVKEQAAELSCSPLECVEPLQIVRYNEGGRFKKHTDGFQRRSSLVIFLNKDYTGGELYFHDSRKQFSNLDVGTAVFFSSSLYHECKPILSGEKWVATCWIDYDEV